MIHIIGLVFFVFAFVMVDIHYEIAEYRRRRILWNIYKAWRIYAQAVFTLLGVYAHVESRIRAGIHKPVDVCQSRRGYRNQIVHLPRIKLGGRTFILPYFAVGRDEYMRACHTERAYRSSVWSSVWKSHCFVRRRTPVIRQPIRLAGGNTQRDGARGFGHKRHDGEFQTRNGFAAFVAVFAIFAADVYTPHIV